MKKAGELKTNKLHLPDQLSEMARRIHQNIEASQKTREASNLKEYLKKEKAVLEKEKHMTRPKLIIAPCFTP
ncbi:hypothetical protein HCJ58_01260 [Listeria sp. FSL L7-1509]|uniref:Uncharacterized protein n=1 Tax=Listeria immobilis TaxID=2713502 RepID=A0ABR6SZQ1_9LIST|nr:hypothetical protein [Listeria immobilis]MBC1482222.1 hypothetical protein [Listeria immobilis]MBC1505615.1 hypothetical protein [Listeria immobilis]MBC1510848.1 hypothetical protein [Listeria immobilis]MBC6302113.1 hypothetical protein [Listeria immobilis]MBC6313442.1 hypothetical protein [Listeria immobilis]